MRRNAALQVQTASPGSAAARGPAVHWAAGFLVAATSGECRYRQPRWTTKRPRPRASPRFARNAGAQCNWIESSPACCITRERRSTYAAHVGRRSPLRSDVAPRWIETKDRFDTLPLAHPVDHRLPVSGEFVVARAARPVWPPSRALLVTHRDLWRADRQPRDDGYARAGASRADGELTAVAGMGGDAGCLAGADLRPRFCRPLCSASFLDVGEI